LRSAVQARPIYLYPLGIAGAQCSKAYITAKRKRDFIRNLVVQLLLLIPMSHVRISHTQEPCGLLEDYSHLLFSNQRVSHSNICSNTTLLEHSFVVPLRMFLSLLIQDLIDHEAILYRKYNEV